MMGGVRSMLLISAVFQLLIARRQDEFVSRVTRVHRQKPRPTWLFTVLVGIATDVP